MFMSSRRMNFLISIIVLKCCLYSVAGDECKCTPTVTDLDRFHNQVLKRRIRSIVFPNKSNLLLTPAFTKAVLDGRPRGLSYSVEFDMYSPLPDTIEGWQPTVLVNKIKQQQRNSTTPNGDILPMSQNESQYFKNYSDFYEFPFDAAEYTNAGEYLESKNHFHPKYFSNKLEFPNPDHFHKLPLKQQKNEPNYIETVNNENNLVRHLNWQHHYSRDQSYREKRQLLEQFEMMGVIFRFNMRACIKRAMCEITNNLKPYGESLIEDIIRLILTIPSPARSNSKHASDHRQNYEYVDINCEQYFALSCPYKVLQFLTKNINTNINQKI